MSLDVSADEAREIKAALERVLMELQTELVHSDTREYRAALRERYDRLERITQRLSVFLDAQEAFV
jgi:hypothetical protein